MRKLLTLLCITGFFAILSSTMSKSPTLSLYAKQLGLSPSEIGLIAASSTITGIFTNVIAGNLSDVYGRKKLLIASGVFFTTAPILYFLTSNAWQLAAVRAYHGLATAIFTPVSMALIADLFREERGKAMGLFSSSTLAGRLLAPSMAGTLIFLADFYSVFTVCAFSGLTALVVIMSTPGHVEAISQRRERFLTGLREALFTPGILAVGLVNAATYFAMQSLETFLPLRLSEAETATWLIGLLFTAELATLAILKPLAGAASDRVGRLPVILVGAILASAGVLAVSMAMTASLTTLGLVTFASGVALITASATPLASELAPKGKYGAAIGSLETIKDIGQALGPILSGVTVSYLGYMTAFSHLAIAPLLSVAVLTVVLKRSGRAR